MVAAETLSRLDGRLVILYGDCPLVRPQTLAGTGRGAAIVRTRRAPS